MNPATLLLLAAGVSADAFAAALSKGLQLRERILFQAVLIGLLFGVAQAVMPLLGWLLGSAFAVQIAPFDHWVAFGLLALVGGKMLWEALRPEAATDDTDSDVSLRELLVLAVATSIDALAVGVSLAFLDIEVWVAAVAIGVTTFVLSFLAVIIGHRIGIRFRKPAEIVGGVVLILIGAQIVNEHLGLL